MQKYTQRLSTYRRALTLSSAFVTRSKDPQKASSNTVSVSGDTRFCRGTTLRFLLIPVAAVAATVPLYCPMFALRKRNCLDRLLFSITSSSVIVTLPAAPHPTPMSAKFLMNSHPSAPAPTRKTFSDSSFCCMVRPKTAICPSWREPCTRRGQGGWEREASQPSEQGPGM